MPNDRFIKSSSPKKRVTPFVVKRKQINFNLLDTTSPQIPSSESRHIYEQLLKDKDEKIKALKNQVESLHKELQQTRHQCRLLENERSDYESSIDEKYAKEKIQVETELRILKETHVEKVQNLSTNLNHLTCTVHSLRKLLEQHNIKEEIKENDILLVNPIYKKDALFIQDAYQQIKQEMSNQQHPMWSNIQATAMAIKHEIDVFQAWKSTCNLPVHELAKAILKEQKSKKTLFGRRK